MLTCGLRALQLKPSTELLANCSWKDSSGDELFVVSERRSGTADVGGGSGTMSIIGGTGKYSGMTGGLYVFSGLVGVPLDDDREHLHDELIVVSVF